MKLSLLLSAVTFPVFFLANLLLVWAFAARAGIGGETVAFARKS